MKIIITGYMGSGSSAVTDLLSEYSNISSNNGSFEYVFLHCPNGVFDLEDKLLHNNNSVRSDEALNEYLSMAKQLYYRDDWWFAGYKKKISENFLQYTEEYISSLIDFRFDGFWYYHQKINRFQSLINILLSFLNNKLKTRIKMIKKYNNEMILCIKKPEEFYEITKIYINKIIDDINFDKKEHVILDQLLLPQNLDRLENYFDNETRVIVVHRDPRDVFFLNKYIWMCKGVSLPFPTEVEVFCRYFKSIMNTFSSSNSDRVLNVFFEDLVYEYEDTVRLIEKFCCLDHNKHIFQYNKFNPKVSINNTNLNPDFYNYEREYIERELSDYIYKFCKNPNKSKDKCF